MAVVGRGFTPNKEAIVSLRPDLLVGDGPSHRNLLQSSGFEDLGFPVIYFSREDFDGIFNVISSFGRITDHQDRAQGLIAGMRLRIDSISQIVKSSAMKPRVYIEVFSQPLISVGNGTLTANMVQLAGGVNIFADAATKFPQVSPETVIQRNPDIIIAVEEERILTDIKSRPGWGSINAVRNNRIFFLDPQLVSPSQRVVDGLEALASAIHPELVRSLTITLTTSPAAPNVRFLLDGREVVTGPDGKVSIKTATGSHVVQIQNTTVAIGSSKRSFIAWGGFASGNANPLTVNLISDGSITANFSPCLIVTATYNGGLHKYVDALRHYRDDVVRQVPAGEAFLGEFDTYYYSFSPLVASEIARSPALREAMEVLLFPLLVSLLAPVLAFQWLPHSMAVVMAGVTSGLLIGVAYLSPMTLSLGKRNRERLRRLSSSLLLIWLSVVMVLTIIVASGSTTLAAIWAPISVLSSLMAGASLIPAIFHWREN